MPKLPVDPEPRADPVSALAFKNPSRVHVLDAGTDPARRVQYSVDVTRCAD